MQYFLHIYFSVYSFKYNMDLTLQICTSYYNISKQLWEPYKINLTIERYGPIHMSKRIKNVCIYGIGGVGGYFGRIISHKSTKAKSGMQVFLSVGENIW